jgi:hypothetical protein
VPIQEAIRLPRLPFAPLDSTIGRLFSLEPSHQLPRDFIWRREHVKDSPDDQSGLAILKRGERESSFSPRHLEEINRNVLDSKRPSTQRTNL